MMIIIKNLVTNRDLDSSNWDHDWSKFSRRADRLRSGDKHQTERSCQTAVSLWCQSWKTLKIPTSSLFELRLPQHFIRITASHRKISMVPVIIQKSRQVKKGKSRPPLFCNTGSIEFDPYFPCIYSIQRLGQINSQTEFGYWLMRVHATDWVPHSIKR